MQSYLLLKYVHIIGATVLLGTGAGIAFFMLSAHRTGDPRVIASVARTVVVADFIFTASAVLAQPISGVLLQRQMGYSLWDGWIIVSITLYVFTGLCWLPVVWMQLRMRDLAAQAASEGQGLPSQYHKLFRVWLVLGFPAFAAVLIIFWLMIVRPHVAW
jgi:uncharacterized membrane protein